MTVDERLPLEFGKLKILSALLKKFAQQKDLPR